ncbi:MAG: MBL fold metallo-hydrolase [Bacilli bacterium]|nr:MBL fold metallo-hydrolase [Bacilli bacterium]
MQKITKKNINNAITYYSCGYCKNNLKHVFKNHKKEIRNFPAGVFLINHNGNLILFDTGYAVELYKCGLISKIYNLFNPTFIKKEDEITSQLKKDGIDTSEIKHIILSHLHPDHIGCVKYFKNAEIIVSEQVYKTYKHPKLRNLIFKKLFHSSFEKNLKIISDSDLEKEQYKYFKGYDLFNDESIILTCLDGHAKGQICCLVNKSKFLAADTCWGNDLIEKSKNLTVFSKLVQDDMKDYNRGLKVLASMKKDNIKLYFSHDIYNCKEL